MTMTVTYLHSVQDLTGRGLLTLPDCPWLFPKTNTDTFDGMCDALLASPSWLTLRSAITMNISATPRLPNSARSLPPNHWCRASRWPPWVADVRGVVNAFAGWVWPASAFVQYCLYTGLVQMLQFATAML